MFPTLQLWIIDVIAVWPPMDEVDVHWSDHSLCYFFFIFFVVIYRIYSDTSPTFFYLNSSLYFACDFYSEHTTTGHVFPWTRKIWAYYAVSDWCKDTAFIPTHTVPYVTEYIIKKESIYGILLHDKMINHNQSIHLKCPWSTIINDLHTLIFQIDRIGSLLFDL